ncbi:secreted frizzled-related protein 1b [Trichomycterus rosablanca]|uniref:secreted frizzled-related protein 1b n=1 Tax=Trichomycterus rosablanca TaxID=2290929 RepID=UPI002F355736
MKMLVLLGFFCLVPWLGSSEYEYVWRDSTTRSCKEIPVDLRLCHGVGYADMLLPNLLDHESMAEVKQQAASWVPLVQRRCHHGTQIFLCALFAPVCMERPVQPCRELCVSVRDACSPIMTAYGFSWPEMFNCSRFPEEEQEMCIDRTTPSTRSASDNNSTCPQCDHDLVLEHMCATEFAFKTKIKETSVDGSDLTVFLQKKKKLVMRRGDLSSDEIKNLELRLINGAKCPCPQLDERRHPYLIMGRRVGQRHLLTGIRRWDKSNQFKNLLKQLKSQKCSAYNPAFK